MRYPCPVDCGADAWSKEELADRRQRARETFWDDWGGQAMPGSPEALDAAIETATRVRVDDDILSAACFASGLHENLYGPPMRAALRAAFAAAGFEIEE